MKSKMILTLTVLLITSQLFGQLFKIPLDQKIREASIIIEGKIVETKPYFGDDNRIYTANKVKIYKAFKGVPSSEYLTIITNGGEVNGTIQTWSHLLTLGDGDSGIFTLIETNRPYKNLAGFPKQLYEVYSSSQGFFRFDFENENITASVPFEYYDNVEEQLYSLFRQHIGTPIIFDTPEWEEDGYGKAKCLVYKFEVSLPNPQNLLELEAKVSVKSTLGQFYLYQSSIDAEYNTAVLGENIVQNGVLQLINTGISTMPGYNTLASDLLNNKVSAKIISNSTSVSSMFLLDENFVDLVKIKVTLEQLGDPEILLSQSEMQQNSEYYNPQSEKPERFGCVLVEGDFDLVGCDCDETPIIESFEPSILRAGTDDILTIRGTCFGDSSAFLGEVEFTNSAFGPSPVQWVESHSNLVTAWSDTLIKIIVPSRTKLGSEFSIKHSAGTGFFRINKDCGASSIGTSSQPIEVKFAALNHIALIPGTTTAAAEPVYLGDYNNIGGQSIAYGPLFKAYSGATDAFERALINWRCATGINYIIQDESEVVLTLAGIVEFEDLPEGVGGSTLNTPLPTDFVPCDSLGYIVGANRAGFFILFNENVIWHTDTLMPTLDVVAPIDTADLESTALHELGHAHLLNHSNDSTDLMFYRKPIGVEYRRVITPHSLEGGNYIMDISTNLASDYCHAKMVKVTGNCEIISDVIEISGSRKVEINLFPNPTDDVLNISLNSLTGDGNLDLDWVLHDINGRKMLSGTLQGFTTINLQELSAGIYFLNLSTQERFVKSFKIIKQ